MQRRTFAVIAVAAGLGLGAVGDLLFYGKQIGVSFPIFVILSLIVVLALTGPAGQRLRMRNLWPVIPILFFAIMVAIRADWQIVTLDVMAVTALGGLVLHYLPLSRPMDEDSLAQHSIGVIETGFMIVPSAMVEAADSWKWARERRRNGLGNVASAARGLIFAAPVVLVFGVLLGSADAVFAKYVDNTMNSILHIFGIQYLADTVGQGMLTMGLATVATGAIGYGVWRRSLQKQQEAISDDEEAEAIPAQEKRKPGFKLSMIEGGIILGSVVALFGVFVMIQFAYFFGGRATLDVTGLTFAEYARRGFFELLAVSVLTLGLALGLDHVTIRQEKRESRLFQVLALMMVGLTTVMLVSAAQRMWLYEEAFGFTQLRVYTHIFIAWLGVLFGVFALSLFRVRKNIFSLGMLLVIIGYLTTMNLLNVDAYIAERNIARYYEGQGQQELDIRFLNILSADALPQIQALYQQSPNDSTVHDWSGQWLAGQLHTLDDDRVTDSSTIFSLNAARQSAWTQLDLMRRSLPDFEPGKYSWIYNSEYDQRGDGW